MDRSTPIPELLQQTARKAQENETNRIELATEYFKKMFMAHDTMVIIKEKVDKLYSSAEYISPSFEGTSKSQSNSRSILEDAIGKIADLKADYCKLLDERAAFDLFVCRLEKKEADVITLRCEKNMSWKQVSSELKISDTTAKNIFNEVAEKAFYVFNL